jgi:Zn-dependent peptidase ImmA (M78 family)
MRHIDSVVIRGLKWIFRWDKAEAKEEKAHGLCYKTEREIVIDPQERPQCLLNTVIHELLHAIMPKASEATVEFIADTLSSALWRMGYRA